MQCLNALPGFLAPTSLAHILWSRAHMHRDSRLGWTGSASSNNLNSASYACRKAADSGSYSGVLCTQGMSKCTYLHYRGMYPSLYSPPCRSFEAKECELAATSFLAVLFNNVGGAWVLLRNEVRLGL